MFSLEELQKRVDAFQKILREKDIDGAILVQRADVLYFTGTAQNVHVYIPSEGKPLVFAARDVVRARSESPWEIQNFTGVSKLPGLISAAGYLMPKVLGMEYDVLPVANFERYRKAFAETTFTDISYALRLQRAIKSQWELTQLQEGSKIYGQVLEYASSILRPGMTEVEFETLLEAKARMLGHEPKIRLRGFNSELHFGGIVAGARAALPTFFDGAVVGPGVSYAHPMGPSWNVIQPGEPVITDITIIHNGYHADMTRVLVAGDVSEKFQKAYEASLEIMEQTRKALTPGAIAGEVYSKILEFVKKETPFADNFMGFGSTQVRFIGHGIGLELDELPVIAQGAKEVLQPGMTLAIEPKFVFPGEGAIGLEDDFVVEGKTGARYLSAVSQKIVRV